MKNIKLGVFLIFINLSVPMISCRDDHGKIDSSKKSVKPNVSYQNDTIRTQYLKRGLSTKPEIDWHGEIGNFSLIPEVEGISISSNTGQIAWDSALIKGNQEFTVIAKNTNGSDTTKVYLDHSLRGIFIGTYDWHGESYFYQMDFNLDGSIIVSSNSPRSKNTGFGTWEIDSLGSLVVNYKYPTGEKASTSGKLISSEGKIAYKGIWFDGLGTLPENEGESFELVMQY